MSIIQIKNLTFSYGSDLLFDHVSLNLDTSWKLGLIGRNGKGKTTFLKLLLRKLDYQGTIYSKEEFSYFPYEIRNPEDLVINIASSLCPDIYEWQIIQEFSRLKLKEEILKTDLLKVFFPNGFTLPELQKVYESVLEKQLDRRNFRKKILNTNMIIPTTEEKSFEGKKKAKVYKFKRKEEEV